MHDITLSFAEPDLDRATSIRDGLQAAGYRVYWDAETPFGEERLHALHSAMVDCKLCVILWSRAALDQHSEEAEGDVMHEAIWSKGEGRHLGVRLDAIELPSGFESIDVFPFDGAAAQIAKIVDGVRDSPKAIAATSPVAAGDAKFKVTALKNGPLKITGDLSQLQLLGDSGELHDMTGKSTIFLCRCGASAKKPFCDGQHAKIGFQTQ